MRLLLLSMLAFVFVAAWIRWGTPFMAQDRCLDAGGSWQDGTCVGAGTSP